MTDDRIERLKRKLAADKARNDKKVEEDAQRAQRAAEQAQRAKAALPEFKAALRELVDELRELFAETGHQLHDVFDEYLDEKMLDSFALGLQPGRATGRMEIIRARVERDGNVRMWFGTKNHSPAGSLNTNVMKFDRGELRTFLLDYIDANVA